MEVFQLSLAFSGLIGIILFLFFSSDRQITKVYIYKKVK